MSSILLTKYLACCVLDLVSKLLVVQHLSQDFLEGMLLTEELLQIFLCLPGYQCGVFIILADIFLGPDTLSPEHPAHFLLMCLQDLWQDDGLQGVSKRGTWLRIQKEGY